MAGIIPATGRLFTESMVVDDGYSPDNVIPTLKFRNNGVSHKKSHPYSPCESGGGVSYTNHCMGALYF